MPLNILNHIPRSISKIHKSIIPVKGNGSYIVCEAGRKYLDYTSGIGALSTGHQHPQVISAVKHQLDNIIHAPQQVFKSHPPQINLTKKLLTIMPTDNLTQIFYTNSGSESTDNAIKIARRYTNKTNIISFYGGFHGRTLGAMAVSSSNTKTKEKSQPLIPGIFFCEPNIESFKKILNLNTSPDETAAVIFEPVQGEGGIKNISNLFLKELELICKKNNILIIDDEVQCGFGRTGTWWNISQKNITADILTFGKGIGSGFPIAGLSTSKEICEKLNVGYLGGTYGGNALVSEAANATIHVVEKENILNNVNIMGTRLNKGLNKIKDKTNLIKEIRQYGLMIAIEFYEENCDNYINSHKIVQILRDQYNILVLMAGYKNQYIRLLPPLNTTISEVDEFIYSFNKALQRAHSLSKY